MESWPQSIEDEKLCVCESQRHTPCFTEHTASTQINVDKDAEHPNQHGLCLADKEKKYSEIPWIARF